MTAETTIIVLLPYAVHARGEVFFHSTAGLFEESSNWREEKLSSIPSGRMMRKASMHSHPIAFRRHRDVRRCCCPPPHVVSSSFLCFVIIVLSISLYGISTSSCDGGFVTGKRVMQPHSYQLSLPERKKMNPRR